MSTEKKLQRYDRLRDVDQDLFCVDGDWYDSPFRRRMTVIRLKEGRGLIVHNPIRLRDEDYAWIDDLGDVQAIIAPNSFHASDAAAYKEQYPRARLLVSRGAEKAVRKQLIPDGILPADWPDEYRPEIDCMEFAGTRLLAENLLFHRPSRTLIATDLVFNLRGERKGVERFLFKLNLIHQRFGPSRTFKMVFLNDVGAASLSLRRILEWDFDRVIMNHGEILESGGREAMLRGFADIGVV